MTDGTSVASAQPQKENLLVQTSKFHSGPLPSPETLAGYESICPGAAERILQMAEKEQNSICKMRELDCIQAKLGMYFGFITLLGVLGLIFYGMYVNQPWIAGVLIAAITGCGIFVKFKER